MGSRLVWKLLFMMSVFSQETMQSALLKQNSYAKFSLNDRNAQVDNNPTTVKLGKELNAIRLSFIPFGRDGMLFQFSSEYPQNVWLACGIEKGQMVLFFGKVKEKVVRILLEDKVNLGEKQFLTVKRNNLQLTVQVNQSNQLKIPLPNIFRNSFVFSKTSSLILGFQVDSSQTVTFTYSVDCCLDVVIVNEKILDLTNGMEDARNIKQCSSLSATECGTDYCSKNGLCRKTIDCNWLIPIYQLFENDKKISFFDMKENGHWLENTNKHFTFNFGETVYISGISGRCQINADQRVQSCPLANFSVQFEINGHYHDYVVNSSLKVFNLFSFDQSYYLTWPVAARSMKLQVFSNSDSTFLGCKLLFRPRGCIDFTKTATELLPPSTWKLLFQSQLSDQMTTYWRQYGPIEDTEVINYQNFASQGKQYKSKLLGILPAFNNTNLEVKVELIDKSARTGNNVASWILKVLKCSHGETFDKYELLRVVLQLQIFDNLANTYKQTSQNCRWTKLSRGLFIYPKSKKDLLMNVFIRRTAISLDAFHMLRHNKLNQSTAFLSMRVQSHDHCARTCLLFSNPICSAFQVTEILEEKSEKETYNCTLSEMTPFAFSTELIKWNLSSHVYLVKEKLRKFLPMNEIHIEQMKLTDINFSNLGFECHCINEMIGTRCDNNTTFKRTYHVIATSPLERIILDCFPENASSVVRIQFALLGEANDVTSRHFPFDFHNSVANAFEVVKAMCNGHVSCTLSIDILQPLVRPGNYTYLEVRSVCQNIDAANDVRVLEKPQNYGNESNLLVFDVFQLEDNYTKNSSTETTPSDSTAILATDSTYTFTSAVMSTNDFLTNIWKISAGNFFASTITNILGSDETTENLGQCQEIVSEGIAFASSFPGIISGKCPAGAIGNAYLECFSNQSWSTGPPDTSRCTSEWVGSLNSMISKALNGNKLDFNATFIADLQFNSLRTKNETEIFPQDIVENTNLVQKLLQLHGKDFANPQVSNATTRQKQNQKLSETLQNTADRLLDQKYMDVWSRLNSSARASTAFSLTESVEKAGFILAQSLANRSYVVQRLQNSLFQINSMKKFSSNHNGHSLQLYFTPHSNQSEDDWMSKAGAMTISFDHDSYHTSGVVFALYKNLEQLLGSLTNGMKINSHVISGTVFSQEEAPSTNSSSYQIIKVVLRHKQFSENTPRCVFWKATAKNLLARSNQANDGGYWSDEGCHVVASNFSHTICECNHLTHFAVLMDTVGVQLDAIHDMTLTITTYLGCGMSVFCLILSLWCFNLLRNVCSIRNSIHKNLCFTLLCAQLLFLVGIDQTSYEILCSMIAGLLHYLFLVVFAWMGIEGLHIYVSLVKVFEIDKRSRLVSYCIFSYVTPGIVVTISAAIRHDGYGTKSSCWLSTGNDYLIWSFVGPALAVICVNSYFFFVALKIMQAHKNISTRNHFENTKVWLKGSGVLLCLLGLTWIFGVLYIDGNMLVMAYLFTACNAFQGVFIFIFHCVLNEKLRVELLKRMRRSRLCPDCIKRRVNRSNSLTTTTNLRTVGSFALKSRRASSRSQEIPNVIENLQDGNKKRNQNMLFHRSLRREFSAWNDDAKQNSAAGVMPSSDLNLSNENFNFDDVELENQRRKSSFDSRENSTAMMFSSSDNGKIENIKLNEENATAVSSFYQDRLFRCKSSQSADEKHQNASKSTDFSLKRNSW